MFRIAMPPSALLASLAAVAMAGAPGTSFVAGDSVGGRSIDAQRIGPASDARVLVIGSIHGDETEGHGILRRLRRERPSTGAALWLARTVNPDGVAASRRTNAREVDLNRNFPYRWRNETAPGNGYYQGPSPASEPETRAAMRLIRKVEPDVTIWFHQPWGQVLAPCRGSAKAEKLYARIARMELKRCRGEELRGTATSWQEKQVGGTAFVVELGPGSLGDRAIRRHARAVAQVARRFTR